MGLNTYISFGDCICLIAHYIRTNNKNLKTVAFNGKDTRQIIKSTLILKKRGI